MLVRTAKANLLLVFPPRWLALATPYLTYSEHVGPYLTYSEHVGEDFNRRNDRLINEGRAKIGCRDQLTNHD